MSGKIAYITNRIAIHRVALHGLFWVCVLFYGLLENWATSENKQAIVEVFLTKLPVQMAIAYFLTYFLLPKYLTKGAYVRFIAILLVSAYGVSVCYSLYRAFYLEPKYPEYFNTRTVHSVAMYFSFKKFLMYITSFYTPAVIMGLIRLVRIQHAEERQRESIEKQMLLAEMSFLKNQLNPHFLFNTLNNLYMLTLKASPQAPEIVARLSETLDYMLYRCKEHAVPVRGEVQLIENYLALEKLRLSDEVVIKFNKPAEPGTATVAPLIMLALVENAFKHGINKAIGEAAVDIDLQLVDSRLIFTVGNTKAPHANGIATHGIGLKNIRRQLELMYPQKHELSIEDGAHHYVAKLQITLN